MRDGQKRDFARDLRGNMTDAELRLWRHLRNRALLGHKFRRQVPMGPYVTDFACLDQRLVVEVDGGQHNGCPGDADRERFLRGQGFTVLRFWNNDVLTDTEAVLAVICEALGPSPQPSPARRRGG